MTSVRDAADRSVLLPLDSERATLATVGGKGTNLARLARAGFPVPGGFLIITQAYDEFLEAAGLKLWLAGQLQSTDQRDPDALTALSGRIRERFRQTSIPSNLTQAITARYAKLGSPPVAVRSSATAEDLPDLSFAGQQDTYLNVRGEQQLLEAVRDCWSSLWTARAIGYRARNGISHDDVALAVVVQRMVRSDVSGVLFTANPLTGRRTETVIDAVYGLGEVLVSGQVEPDHYVVETETGRIDNRIVGAKAKRIRDLEGGGTVVEIVGDLQSETLDPAAIRQLVELGRQVAAVYDFPQDIEWAIAEGRLYLLQSRPITSLYPVPGRGNASSQQQDLHLFLSFGAVQGMLDPITPFGQDTLKAASSGGARLFGVTKVPAHPADAEADGKPTTRPVDYRNQPVLHSAGSRLWIDITGLVRNGLGRKVVTAAFGIAEPGAAGAFQELLHDPRLAPTASAPGLQTLRKILPAITAILRRLLASLWNPERARSSALSLTDEVVTVAQARMEQEKTLAGRLAVHEALTHTVFHTVVSQFLPRIAAGYLPLNLLLRLGNHLATVDPAVDAHTALSLTRGLPHNVTTEMDLALWQTAETIRGDAGALETVQHGAAEDLAVRFRDGSLPHVAQCTLHDFLHRYGVRGLAEIDIGRPRWQENPAPVIRTLQSFLSIQDDDAAPSTVFRRGAMTADKAVNTLSEAAQRTFPVPIAGWLVRQLAGRVRGLAGLRESPKFTIVRMLGVSRAALLESAQPLVDEGTLERAEDLFYLHFDEARVLAMGAPGDWKRLVRMRRERYEREKARRPIPRLLLSDGLAIYEGMGAGAGRGGALIGSPVSPGIVEGEVHVVFDPHKANLRPGEILVCPGTDPAWTPLFLTAGGLVMEVGGLMTHGSVVAREYGIPAVVGVDRATERLKTGQRVRVDGSKGEVLVLADEA